MDEPESQTGPSGSNLTLNLNLNLNDSSFAGYLNFIIPLNGNHSGPVVALLLTLAELASRVWFSR